MKLLTVKEAAVALTLKPKTVNTWITLRKIATHRIGRLVRVPQTEIDRILTEGHTPAEGR